MVSAIFSFIFQATLGTFVFIPFLMTAIICSVCSKAVAGLIGFSLPERINYIVQNTKSWYTEGFTSILEGRKKDKLNKQNINSTNLPTEKSIEEKISVNDEQKQQESILALEIEQSNDEKFIGEPSLENDSKNEPYEIKEKKIQLPKLQTETGQAIIEFTRIVLLALLGLAWAGGVWWLIYWGLSSLVANFSLS